MAKDKIESEQTTSGSSSENSSTRSSSTTNVNTGRSEDVNKRTTVNWGSEEEEAYKAFVEGDGLPFYDRMRQAYKIPDKTPYANKEAEANRRAKAANISEAVRLMIDMGSGAIGGNIYKRDGVNDVVKDNLAKADAARDKYQSAVDEYNKKMMEIADYENKYKRDVKKQMLLKSLYTTTEKDSKYKKQETKDSEGDSNKSSSTYKNTKGEKDVVLPTHSSRGGRGGTKVGGNVILLQPKVTKDQHGNVVNQGYAEKVISAEAYDSVEPVIANYILRDKKLLERIVELTGYDEDTLKQSLSGENIAGNMDAVRRQIVSNYWYYNEQARKAVATFVDVGEDSAVTYDHGDGRVEFKDY